MVRRPFGTTVLAGVFLVAGLAGSAAFWRTLAPDGVELEGGADIDADGAALLVSEMRAAGAEATAK